jgi:class 3 adenylate cyclase/tetratricopeptide (TPR) repeat protein
LLAIVDTAETIRRSLCGGNMAQTATILVTDLVGSTETRVRLGEDHAEDLRRAHDALLVGQAAAHGGNVIKGLGDGVLVAFAGAAEALSAAVAMQQALDAYRGREGLALTMRVGLSAGDVTFEDGDCFGTPVIEASRLCAVADPGQILVADLVRLLARGRANLELESRGSMTLKGLPDELDVWAVQWEPASHGRVLRTTTPYVGREHERELLADAWRAAAKGNGGVVLIAGEPGIGKTRLVEELGEQIVRPGGGVVLFGACHDGDVVANAPFVEAISDWVRRSPLELVAETIGAEAAVVARMVPAIADALPDVGEPLAVSRDAETPRLHDALGQLLLRMSAAAPVALVIDDLHWADDATVGMLRAVSRTARRAPMLVIGTYRETDLDRRHPFAQALAVLQREVEPIRVMLSGLDVSDVHAMLEGLAEHDVPQELAAMLATETEGNPFFLRETIFHLVDEGELRFEGGVWTLAGKIADLGVPAGIRDVIGRRLSRLPDTTNRLLSVGALFEVGFPLPIAAEVAEVEEMNALDAIDAALAARIVRATDAFDQYAFTHALFRHALVEELNPSRQVRMHRAIATALEKNVRGAPTPEEAAALARHYHRSAALPNAERGVPYAIAAADDAARRYARREEYDAVSVALELLGEGDEREVGLHRRRAEAAVFGNVGSERVLEAARAAGELIRAGTCDDDACEFVAHLAAECGPLDDVRLAWDMASVARQWLRPERRDATYAWLRAFELAQREFDDPEHPGIPLDTPERRELVDAMQALPPSERSLSRWFSTAMPYLDSRAEAERAREGNDDHIWYPLWVLGAHRELCARLREEVEEARASGVIPSAVLNLAMLSRVHTVLGEYDTAQACLDEGFALVPRIAEASNPAFQLFVALAGVAFLRGEILPSGALAGLAPYGDAPDVRWAWIAITAFRGSLLAEEGNAEEAIAVLREVVPVVERAGAWAPNYPILVHLLVRMLWALQRTDELDVIERNVRIKIVEPDMRYPETDGRWMLALLCALDGRIDEAHDWFDEARRVLTEQGSVALLIWVDYDEATMNSRLGTPDDLARARALLDRARARCTHPAVAPWVARIDELSGHCTL